MLRMTQEFGAHAGRQLTFDQDRVRLGRQPSNDVPFDPNVDLDASGNHCEIRRESGQYILVDLDSRNGTFVNGQRVSRHALRSGDLIECGRGGPRLRVELLGAPSFAAAPPPFAPAAPVAPAAHNPFAPPAAAPHAAPVANAPPAGPFAAAPPFAQPAAPPSPPFQPQPPAAAPLPGSVGGAVAAQLPAGAKVGKATVAMMIDQALAQSEQRRGSSGAGVKVALVLTLIAVLAIVGGAVAYITTREPVVASNDSASTSAGGGEQITSQYESAIYLLAAQVPGTPNPRGFCTGFSVTNDLIATNAHCIDAGRQFLDRGATLVAMRSSGRGARVPIVPVYRDSRFRNPAHGIEGSGFDVGLVRAAQPLPTQVRVASDAELLALRAGSQVYVYGFPGLTMNETSPVATITAGVLNRTTDFFERAAEPPQAQKIQHSAQTTSGSSGSPIFLASGLVIGVNAGSLSDEERQRILDPRTGQAVQVEVNRSSNFKYGMRADIIRAAVAQVGGSLP